MNTINNLFDYSSLLQEFSNSNIILNSNELQPIFSDPQISDYFERSPMSKEARKADASLEKKLAVSIAKYIAQQTGVSQEDVINGTRKAIDLLRNVKYKNLFYEGKIDGNQYETYLKYSKSALIIAAVKAAYRFLKNKGLTKVLSKALEFVVKKIPHPYIQTAIRIWDAIPHPVKEIAKNVAIKCVEKAAEKLPVIAQRLYDTGKKVVKKSCVIISKGASIAYEKGKSTVQKVKSFVKAAASKVKKWVKSPKVHAFVKKLLSV